MKKGLKIALTTILSVVGVVVLVVGGYVAYVAISYNRIADNLTLDVISKSNLDKLESEKEYSITTYNIGFGAYSQDYTFFLDEGIELDGSRTTGKNSKGKSKQEVQYNTDGAIALIKELNPDFSLFQEVDTDSTRSYHINQNDLIGKAFDDYDLTHAVNFHSAYLAYPFNDMHGKSNAGITTISKYKINNAVRKKFTVSTSFSKFFDLDRCFSVNELSVDNDKKLYLINVHMSAYDEGGVIRKAQREELNTFLTEASSNGDYVIVGGDYNHDLLTYNPEYNYDINNIPFKDYIGQLKPDWLQYFYESDGSVDLTDGFKVVASDNAPTCRSADTTWEIGHSYVATIDGFIISNNVEVSSVRTIVSKNGNKGLEHFAYSDHDPVYMTFKLK